MKQNEGGVVSALKVGDVVEFNPNSLEALFEPRLVGQRGAVLRLREAYKRPQELVAEVEVYEDGSVVCVPVEGLVVAEVRS